jgi:bile acid-coenzyme A ligase
LSSARSFGSRIAGLADAHPEKLALAFMASDGREELVDWRTLDQRANQMARLLGEAGAGPGTTVTLAIPNSPTHVTAAIAAWRVGACVLPVRADVPSWERRRLLDLARPEVVVGDWEEAGDSRLYPRELEASVDLPAEPLDDRVADPFLAITSSGSSGLPKLIVSLEPGLYDPDATTYQTAAAMGSAGEEVQLVPTALYHTNGFRIAHSGLQRDETVVLMERFDAARAVELIERHRVTRVTMAPIMLLRISRLPGIEKRDLSSLRSVLQGAAPCPPWLVRWWIERLGAEKFFIAYGASERIGVTMIRGDEWLRRPGSVGRGMRTDIRILGEDGAELPPGEIGDVYMRQSYAGGPTFRYVGAPPPPATPDGFLTVGDLGKLDEDGYLYLVDRRTDMIVTGGANVFPAEVEAALLEHPSVADVAVVGVADPEWGRRVEAVVEPTDPRNPPSEGDLKAHCKVRLASYKVPKRFHAVGRLARGETGKINRAEIARSLEDPARAEPL